MLYNYYMLFLRWGFQKLNFVHEIFLWNFEIIYTRYKADILYYNLLYDSNKQFRLLPFSWVYSYVYALLFSFKDYDCVAVWPIIIR